MSLVVMGRKANGTLVELPITVDGKLDVSASVAAPEGGATSAKQDEQSLYLDSINDKLPVLGQALAAASVPVVLPAAQITSLAPFPAASTPSDTIANPSTSSVMALSMGYNASLSQWGRARIDSTNYLQVRAHPTAPASSSRSTALQIQRTIAGFSCTPKCIRAFTATAGWIALFNASSTVSTGATPYGGHIYRVEANQTLVIDWHYNESFTTGLVIAHLSQAESGGSLSTVVSATACCMFTGQYD